MHEGQFFFSDGHNGKGRRYWRCRKSKRFNCKARMVTNTIDGYEMMKVQNGNHSHADADLKKVRPVKKT